MECAREDAGTLKLAVPPDWMRGRSVFGRHIRVDLDDGTP